MKASYDPALAPAPASRPPTNGTVDIGLASRALKDEEMCRRC
ncbi:MAG: hypothetical protein ACLUJG_08670 [Lawsonibacter sp.]